MTDMNLHDLVDKRSGHLLLLDHSQGSLNSGIDELLGHELMLELGLLADPAQLSLELLLAGLLVSEAQTG